jgi:hypothetical protein
VGPCIFGEGSSFKTQLHPLVGGSCRFLCAFCGESPIMGVMSAVLAFSGWVHALSGEGNHLKTQLYSLVGRSCLLILIMMRFT